MLLAAAFLLTLFPNFAFADFDPASISTPYVCLMEAETGAVLYEHNAQEQAFPASTTKIMTCILTIEMCDDLYETINIGRGFDTGGSVTRPYALTRDEEIRIIDLLYCTMMVSGNDASSALAIYLAGSQEEFANLMNKKAAEIGMVNTHFVNANGLHDENHYTTAYDMALLAQYAMQNQAFRDIVSTETFEVPATNKNPARLLENANRLIHTKADTDNLEYAYATGIKTGDTAYAGRCLVASAQHDGVELLLVLFGDMEGEVPSEYRFENAAKFFDWGFARFATAPISSLNLITEFSAPVSNAAFDSESAGGVSVRAELDPNAKIGGLSDKIQNIQANAASITANPIYTGGTLTAPLQDTGRKPSFYDLIVTGDLATVGKEIVLELCECNNIKMHKNYDDCGCMIFRSEECSAGGSGCGCSAVVLTSYILDRLKLGHFKRVLFCGTGALLSPVTSFQGESIPGICHLIELERENFPLP